MNEAGKAKRHRWSNWNPFLKFDSENEALKAAKSGAVVGICLALSYQLQVFFLYFSDTDTFGDEGTGILASDIIAIAIVTILSIIIFFRQSLWATVLVSAWIFVELMFKILAIIDGQQKTNAGWIFVFFALSCGAIIAVRGSLKLRLLRRTVS